MIRDITLDTPHGELQNVWAEFRTEVETYHAEPFTTGGSRGMGTVASATLRDITLGELRMSRSKLVQWIGAAAVAGIEDAVANELAEGVML